jgi:hypothetical protein
MIVAPRPVEEWGTICQVCGYDLGFPAWQTATRPSYRTCPSCGTHFGVDDVSYDPPPWLSLVKMTHLRMDWIQSRRLAWTGLDDDPAMRVPPVGWDPVGQLLRISVDIRSWYPTWAEQNPVPEEPPAVNVPDEIQYIDDWAPYAQWVARHQTEEASEVAFRWDVNTRGAVDILIVGQDGESDHVLDVVLATRNLEFALELARIVAAELHVPIRPLPERPEWAKDSIDAVEEA